MIESGRSENPGVLIVDDEPAVLESLADLLRKEFHVLATTDPEEALALLSTGDIAVVLSDQRMPRQTGVDLLAKASALCPETIRVLLTGYADIEVVIQAVNDAKVFYFLSKPWKGESILGLVRTAVEAHNLAVEERRLLRRLGALKSEAALSHLRSDPASDAVDSLSRDVASLRSGIATAELALVHLKQGHEKIRVCVSCHGTPTSAGPWVNLVDYLRSSSPSLQDVLCPTCSAREATAREEARNRA